MAKTKIQPVSMARLETLLALLSALFIFWQFNLLYTHSWERGAERFDRDIRRTVERKASAGAFNTPSEMCRTHAADLPASCRRQIRSGPRVRLQAWLDKGLALVEIEKARTPPPSLAAYARQIQARANALIKDYNSTIEKLETHWQAASESYVPDVDTAPNPDRAWWQKGWERMRQYFQDRFQNADQRRNALFQREIARNISMVETKRELASYFEVISADQQTNALDADVNRLINRYNAALKKGDRKTASQHLFRLASALNGRRMAGETAAQARLRETCRRLLTASHNGNNAMQSRAIYVHGGSAFIIWTLAALVMIALARREVPRLRLTSVLILVWLGVAWLTCVPVTVLQYGAGAVTAVLFWIIPKRGAPRDPDAPQRFQTARQYPLSAWLLPGWILMVGLGWLVIADLSLNFHIRNRYLALRHYHDIWMAMALITTVTVWRTPLINLIQTLIARWNCFFHRGRNGFTRLIWNLPALAVLALLPVSARLFGQYDYITGELYKTVFILVTAWFLIMRADAIYSGGWRAQSRLAAPVILLLISIAAALLLARDMGPLPVIGLACIVILGAYMGLRFTLLSIGGAGAIIYAAVRFLPWFALVRHRIDIMREPFSAPNEHLAKLLWFQAETPFWGFGPGQSPWCGYTIGASCNGLPRQLHSDYTITALQGIYGVMGWMIPLLMTLWLFILIKNHALNPGLAADPFDAKALRRHFLAWIALLSGTMLFLQTVVTVAGNMGRLPITGITLPFISYGSVALLTATFCLACCLIV